MSGHRDSRRHEESPQRGDDVKASYRAAGALPPYRCGLASDWYEWVLKRVKHWPDTNRRDSQLAEMEEPGYRENLQKAAVLLGTRGVGPSPTRRQELRTSGPR